jgi:hypothetical protein
MSLAAYPNATNAPPAGPNLPPAPGGWNGWGNGNMKPGLYQNAGDWTWIGARMVQQLIKHSMLNDAMKELRPFVDRVCDDGDFREWYDPQLATPGQGKWKASGASVFHGSAGELGTAIKMLHERLNRTHRKTSCADCYHGSASKLMAEVKTLQHHHSKSFIKTDDVVACIRTPQPCAKEPGHTFCPNDPRAGQCQNAPVKVCPPCSTPRITSAVPRTYLALDTRNIQDDGGAEIVLGPVTKTHTKLITEERPWEMRFDNMQPNVSN